MATTVQAAFVQPSHASSNAVHEPPKITSIKALAESPNLQTIPSQCTFFINPDDFADPNDPEFSVPVIDYSLFTSSSPEQRSKIIHDLANICKDWGFFMLINHGMPESLRKDMFDAFNRFFELPEEEKQKIQSYGLFDPVKYTTSFNPAVERIRLWRDCVKIQTHPEFHTLDNPSGFKEVSLEFSKSVREMALRILEAISEGLDVESDYMYKTLDLKNGLFQLAANYYPACPQPEKAIGIPQHTDPGLITFLMDNDISGLQLQHNAKWVKVNALPNSILVNLADFMEIVTNGKYKSVVHRACLNNKATRMSIAIAHGPSLDKEIGPGPEFVKTEGQEPKYRPITYRDYIQLQQGAKTHTKPPLERIRI